LLKQGLCSQQCRGRRRSSSYKTERQLGRLLHHGDVALACSSEGRHGHSTLPLLTRQLHNSRICWTEFQSNTTQHQKNQKTLQRQQHRQVAQVLGLCTNNNHKKLCRTLCNKKRPQQRRQTPKQMGIFLWKSIQQRKFKSATAASELLQLSNNFTKVFTKCERTSYPLKKLEKRKLERERERERGGSSVIF
jgi:leucyl aminopeptidase